MERICKEYSCTITSDVNGEEAEMIGVKQK